MKTNKILLLTTFALLLPSVSWAGITFTPGNNPQPGEENVLLSNGTTGNTVQGSTNQTHFAVNFISTQTITEPSSGQARIEATNNGSQIALTNVAFSIPGGTFTDTIFNMFIGGTVGTSGGTATISVNGSMGVATFTETLGNGQNFLTIVATGGETINSVAIDYGTGFTDLREVRISGATGGVVVPDAGTSVSLLGLALVGLGLFRRKFTAV
jgi:VPDSG-CTERM motif